MALAYPKLQLPDAPETLAFRTIDRILRADPVLARVVRTWKSWTGDATDNFDPTYATCPFLRIGPSASASSWETEGQHRTPLVVGFQLAVAGTDIDQLINLWGALRSALWPLDPTRGDANKTLTAGVKIVRPQLSMSGYGVNVGKDDEKMLVSSGQLELLLHISTP